MQIPLYDGQLFNAFPYFDFHFQFIEFFFSAFVNAFVREKHVLAIGVNLVYIPL